MALSQELAKLHEVQKLDYQIYSREQAIKALDNGEAIKLKAIDIMKRHDAAQSALHKLEAALRDKELALKTLEQKKATVHDKLYSGRINNPKELGDLEKDEMMLGEQVSTQEGAVLELMEQTESARTVAEMLAGELSTAKRRWKDTVAHTQAETARMQQEIAALKPEREAKAALVEKTVLRRYDEIRSRREGIGMAVTGNDSCPICHIKLTAQVINSLREGMDLTICESCSRILAWEGFPG